jgi:acyl-CoA-binding protein
MVSMNYFDKIAENVKSMILNKRDQYFLGALYRQIKEGNTTTDNSNITDVDELGVWNEWNKLRGMNQEILMNKYCDYITLIINWQEKGIYKYN